jgi:Uma2 family endonuclease
MARNCKVLEDHRAPKPAAHLMPNGELNGYILSPSDKQEEIDEKVALYLETGVAVVWVVNARFKTICVYRPGADPEMFSARHELAAEPHLPGFRVAVARLLGS